MCFFYLFTLPSSCASVVIVVLDGLGNLYLGPNTPHTLDGKTLPNIDVPEWMEIDCSVVVRASETSTSLAILFTGYRRATPETLSYENATIFDIFRNHGYHVYGIMEQGDNRYMLNELDGAISFKGDPEEMNLVFTGEAGGWDVVDGGYDGWSIREAIHLIDELAHPFILVVEIASIDMAGHRRGVEAYIQEAEQTLNQLGELVDICKEKKIVVVITADHGMAFKNGRGGHANIPYRFTDEVRIVPLYVSDPTSTPSQKPPDFQMYEEDVAPFVLSLVGINETPRYHESREPIQAHWKILGVIVLFFVNVFVYALLKRK
jgi:hypothetical protein